MGNEDQSSQIGLLTFPFYSYGFANILHFSIVKIRQIAGSALVAELFTLAHALDQASTLRILINSIHDRQMYLTLYTNINSLYDGLLRMSETLEKRILTDLSIQCQTYERWELSKAVWILSE